MSVPKQETVARRDRFLENFLVTRRLHFQPFPTKSSVFMSSLDLGQGIVKYILGTMLDYEIRSCVLMLSHLQQC